MRVRVRPGRSYEHREGSIDATSPRGDGLLLVRLDGPRWATLITMTSLIPEDDEAAAYLAELRLG